MSEEALTPSIKRGFILIRDDFQREGESYADLSEYEQEDMFLYPRLRECFLYEYNGSP